MSADRAIGTHPMDALIPHRPPMQLVDWVAAMTPEALWAAVHVQPDSPFARKIAGGAHGVPSWLGLEYLGQAAAAYFSLHAASQDKDTNHEAAGPGMLISTRAFTCEVPFFPQGCQLLVRVRPVSGMPAAGLHEEGSAEKRPDTRRPAAPAMVKFDGCIAILPADIGLDGNTADSNERFPSDEATLRRIDQWWNAGTQVVSGDLSVYLPSPPTITTSRELRT